MLQQSSIFAQSPSFNSYSSNNFAEIAAKVCEEFIDEREQLGLEPVPKTTMIKEEEEEEESEEQIISSSDDLSLTHQEEQQPEQAEEEVVVVVEVEEVEESGNKEASVSESESDDEFEFSFVCRDPNGSPLSADELFANGQIRPVFPVFNRDLLFAGGQDDDSNTTPVKKSTTLRVPLKNLFLGEREDSTDPPSSSSSEADELENLPAGTYCVWTPKGNKGSSESHQASPETCKKSNSTGSGSSSSSRRFRFRDFLFRSNSDGKDTFVFLTPSGSGKMKKKDEKAVEKMVSEEKKKHSGEAAKVAGKGKMKGEVSAHEIHYVRNRALKQNDRRKSYLPYRQDLVGFFANVNGLSRNLQPF